MDAERSQRIEEKLEQIHRELVPRSEFDRREARLESRFDRIDQKVDQVLATQSSHDTRLGVIETKLGDHEDLARRVGAVEDVAAVQRNRGERKSWMWPSVATIGATCLNAVLTAITYMASPHGS